jgi:uncharacterized membrane protein YphA (DoxX/SURF4 family)
MALLRMFLGAKFLQHGIAKWGWMGTGALKQQLVQWTTGDAPAAYVTYIPFLNKYILPHVNVYSYCIVIGELLIGALLVLGLTSRAAALIALFMSANYALATWNAGFEWQAVNEAFMALELAVIITGAGRTAGIDAALARKRPSWPLW